MNPAHGLDLSALEFLSFFPTPLAHNGAKASLSNPVARGEAGSMFPFIGYAELVLGTRVDVLASIDDQLMGAPYS